MNCRERGTVHRDGYVERGGGVESRWSSVKTRVVGWLPSCSEPLLLLLLPLCVFCISPHQHPSMQRTEPKLESRRRQRRDADATTTRRVAKRKPSLKPSNSSKPQRSAISPTVHIPAYFSHARKQPKQPPRQLSENMPRAPPTPVLRNKYFQLSRHPPPWNPQLPIRRAMNESHISRLHVPQAILASFSPNAGINTMIAN